LRIDAGPQALAARPLHAPGGTSAPTDGDAKARQRDAARQRMRRLRERRKKG
jgi:hypothetical protein